MKIYKCWSVEKPNILIHEVEQWFAFPGRSNVSLDLIVDVGI